MFEDRGVQLMPVTGAPSGPVVAQVWNQHQRIDRFANLRRIGIGRDLLSATGTRRWCRRQPVGVGRPRPDKATWACVMPWALSGPPRYSPFGRCRGLDR